MRRLTSAAIAGLLVVTLMASSAHPGSRHHRRCFGRRANIVGGPADDVRFGGPGADVMRGKAGHDVLIGLEGNDRLCGGSGDDDLRGDTGFDRAKGGHGEDRCDAEIERNC